MKERNIYQCDYCKKRLMNKSQMKIHEEVCWFKIENKTCLTCIHREVREVTEKSIFEDKDITYSKRFCKANELYNIDFEGLRPKENCPLWKEPNEINDPYEQYL